MFTSRAEFRLHLRIDNADRRLTPHGRRVGLITDQAWVDFQAKQERQNALKKLLENTRLTSSMMASIQHSAFSSQMEASNGHVGTGALARPAEPSSASLGLEHDRGGHAFSGAEVSPEKIGALAPEVSRVDLTSALGQPLAQLLKRPEIVIEQLVPLLRELATNLFADDQQPTTNDGFFRNELKSVETEIKYEGYLQQQQRAIERLKKAEQRNIPDWFDYKSVSGLSREMQEKLLKIRPRTLGHASRIPGVTPAAVSLVNVYIEIQAKRREQVAAV
jgi:tRNA uridine 5-carboxymethylaminomethyl modification enzyme